LIGLPVARGLIVANGKNGTSEAGWKGWELLPIWINEGAGIASPMRFSRPGTFFRDCRERVLSNLPDVHHINSRCRGSGLGRSIRQGSETWSHSVGPTNRCGMRAVYSNAVFASLYG
jgi:hypothetical protein